MRDIKIFGIIGVGVIGAGWAARALAHGLKVIAWDPAPDGEKRLLAAVKNAWPALQKVGLFPGASLDNLSFASSMQEMAEQADFIQESAPEILELKTKIHTELDQYAAKDVIIASSTSGLLPSDFQKEAQNPERILVGHPFNPVYLLPLCEILGGEKTSSEALAHAAKFYETISMYSLKIRNEIEGFLSDRLQEALWRENLHLINDGIATPKELDDAIIYGPGLRWAFMGVNKTFTLAGGDAGMRHFMKQFGPALELPWTKLKAPEFTEELVEAMVEGTAEFTENTTIKELERLRDDCLIAVMNALRAFDEGAGALVQKNESRRIQAAQEFQKWQPGDTIATPLKLYENICLPEWVDYNGHMTESAYLTAMGWASDALFRYIGDDETYRESGLSFYTVETHINYLRECSTGDPLTYTTQIIDLDSKRLHLFHRMYHRETGEELASAEQMLLHVNTQKAQACPIRGDVFEALQAIWTVHKEMEMPKGAGRKIEIKKK